MMLLVKFWEAPMRNEIEAAFDLSEKSKGFVIKHKELH